MDDDEAMDRLRWEVITPDTLRAACQLIERGEMDAILNFERNQGAPLETTERVIVF